MVRVAQVCLCMFVTLWVTDCGIVLQTNKLNTYYNLCMCDNILPCAKHKNIHVCFQVYIHTCTLLQVTTAQS